MTDIQVNKRQYTVDFEEQQWKTVVHFTQKGDLTDQDTRNLQRFGNWLASQGYFVHWSIDCSWLFVQDQNRRAVPVAKIIDTFAKYAESN